MGLIIRESSAEMGGVVHASALHEQQCCDGRASDCPQSLRLHAPVCQACCPADHDYAAPQAAADGGRDGGGRRAGAGRRLGRGGAAGAAGLVAAGVVNNACDDSFVILAHFLLRPPRGLLQNDAKGGHTRAGKRGLSWQGGAAGEQAVTGGEVQASARGRRAHQEGAGTVAKVGVPAAGRKKDGGSVRGERKASREAHHASAAPAPAAHLYAPHCFSWAQIWQHS